MTNNRRFGFWTLTFLVIGNMIGAGVFTTSGYSLADLRSPWMVVAAWFVGGLIAITGAISYGKLVRHIPESGGEYLFLSRAVHPLFGCIAGWVSLVAGFTGPIAFAATTFEAYSLPAASRPSWCRADMLACAVIILCLAWHAIRPKIGEYGQNIVVTLKLVMLFTFLVVAAFSFNSDNWQGASTAVSETPIVVGNCFGIRRLASLDIVELFGLQRRGLRGRGSRRFANDLASPGLCDCRGGDLLCTVKLCLRFRSAT